MGSIIFSTVDKSDAYKALRSDMAALGASHVKAGFPEGAPVGEQKNKRVIIKGVGSYRKIAGTGGAAYADMSEVARIAAWNEFGVPQKNIPKRPFFRNFVDGGRSAIADFKQKIAGQVIDGKITPKNAFELLGIFAKNGIQRAIRAMREPPNAPATRRAKHSSHPLIDTGQMLASVTHVTVPGAAGASTVEAVR